jgi:hypothetical protein
VSQLRPGDEPLPRIDVMPSLYQRVETLDRNGQLVDRRRRFLIFSDRLDEHGTRTLSILGLPILERTRT